MNQVKELPKKRNPRWFRKNYQMQFAVVSEWILHVDIRLVEN